MTPRRMLRNRKIKRNWNGEDLTLLVWAVSQRLQQQGLAHFAEMVYPFLCSKGKIGSSSQDWSQAAAGRSASLDGWALRRSVWSLISGPKPSHGYLQKQLHNRVARTGNWSPNCYMNGTPPGIRSFARPSSAENTGTASSIQTYTRDPGHPKKTGDFWSMYWNYKERRSGRRLPSSWQAGQKTHSKIDLTCSWGLRSAPREI